MTSRTPVILLALVVALGAYVFFFERDRPGRSEIVAREGFLLELLIRERVTGFALESGGEVVALSREGEGFDESWSFVDRDAREADFDAVEDYLRNWEFAMPVRVLESPSSEDMQNFGLNEPESRIRFEVGRATTEVALGTGKPVDGGGYLRIDDRNQVVVVPASVVALFDATSEQFRVRGDGGAPTLDDLVGAEPTSGAAEQKDAAVATPPPEADATR